MTSPHWLLPAWMRPHDCLKKAGCNAIEANNLGLLTYWAMLAKRKVRDQRNIHLNLLVKGDPHNMCRPCPRRET